MLQLVCYIKIVVAKLKSYWYTYIYIYKGAHHLFVFSQVVEAEVAAVDVEVVVVEEADEVVVVEAAVEEVAEGEAAVEEEEVLIVFKRFIIN